MTGVTVFCIRVEGKEPGPVMSEAYEAFQEMEDLCCEWLAEAECHKLEKLEKHNVYVFEEFGSAAFEHVVSTKNRVFGPMCILACMKKSESLPHQHPMFCLAMQGLVISCTSMPKEQRTIVHRHIEWMGGEVSRDFHGRVSHLVAGEVCSKKYRVATDLKKPVMSLEWVEAMMELSHTKLIRADDPHYLKQYRCLVFKGLVVTVSGLDSEERSQIKELIESEGGKYSGEMKMDECTHLVITSPQGNKYEFAKKWQLKIVKPQWVMESVEQGFCLEEHKYKVGDEDGKGDGRKAVTSTPNRRSGQNAAGISHLGDVSAITVANIEDTTLNFTANQTLAGSTQPGKQSPAATDGLEGLKLSGWKGGMFLDGCKIFLSGFTSQQLDKLKKMLNLAGAIRFNDITENLTHVVMGQKIEEHVKRIQALSSRPHIVSISWLLDGFNAKKCVPEELYYTLEAPETDVTHSPTRSVTKKTDSKSTKKDVTPQAQSTAPGSSMDTTGFEDILSQYLPQGSSLGTMGESTLVRMADQAEVQAATTGDDTIKDGGAAKGPQQQDSYEDAETQDPNDMTEVQEEESMPFRGKSFITFGFDEEQTADLHKYIVECGGEISPLNTRRIPDYGIVPIMGYRVGRTVGEVVTNAWLQICMEMDALQPVESNEIYTPLDPRDENARPLEGVVLSISGYVGAERDVIAHISEILGGVCQDFFVRKANAKRGLVGNSHLVVNAAEGSKFEAAVKWGIPAVDKAWVVACAKQSKRMPEGPYLVGKSTELEASVSAATGKPTPSQEKMPPPPAPPSVKRVTDPLCSLQSPPPVTAGYTSRNKSEEEVPAKKSPQSRDKSESVSDQEETGNQEREGAMETEDHVTEGDHVTEMDDVTMGEESSVFESEEEAKGTAVTEDGDDWTGLQAGDTGSTLAVRQPGTSLDSVASVSREPMLTPKSVGSRAKSRVAGSMGGQGHLKTPATARIEMQTPDSVVVARAKIANWAKLKVRQENGDPAKVATPKRGFTDVDVSGLDTPSKILKKGVIDKPQLDLEKLREENRDSSKVASPMRGFTDLDTSKLQYFDTPPKKKEHIPLPKLDLTKAYAALDAMPTPGRKPGQKPDSMSLNDLLSYSLEIAIKKAKMRLEQKEQQEQQSSWKPPPSPACPSPGVLKECTPRALTGVVIAVAKKLITRQSDYNTIASSLGAEYRWTYDKTCTHFIFEGKQYDINKEFQLAKEHKKIIVSPHWLLMCQEQNCWVDESLYPHTYNPNKSLSLSSTPARSTRTTRTQSRLTRNQPTEDVLTKSKTRNQAKGKAASKSTQEKPATVTRATASRATRQSLRQRKGSEADSSSADTSKENIDHAALLSEQEVRISRREAGESPDRIQSDEEATRLCSELELEDNSKSEGKLVNDLKNLMAANTKTYSKQWRKNRRSESSFDQVLQEENEAPQPKKSRPNSRNVSRAEDEENKSRNNSRCSSRNSNLLPETQASQMMEVIWDDPKAREQQEKLASDLAKYNQSVSPTGTEVQADSRHQGRTSSALDQLDMDLPDPQRLSAEGSVEERIPTPEAPSLAFPLVSTSRPGSPPRPVEVLSSEEEEEGYTGEKKSSPVSDPPVFLLSGIPAQERNEYGALVEELGGEVVDTQNFDRRATHLAIEKPTRNEKFLASVAAGKWVIHKSYFKACKEEGRFVKPDCYEWGTEYTSTLCSGGQRQKLASAAHRWRKNVQQGEKQASGLSRGAFSEWRVILLTKKEDSFTRLLQAGGAQVVATRPPFTQLEGVTHAFLDLAKVKVEVDVDELVRAGVECCVPEFIASYLTDDPLPETSNYYVQGISSSVSEARKRRPSPNEAQGAPGNKKKKPSL